MVFNLAEPNPSIHYAVRNERVVADATACQVVGWNAPTGAAPTQNLMVLNVPILNRDNVCNLAINHNGLILESMLCAGTVAVNAGGICEANRGGGLYCNNVLVGIVSFGFGCGTIGNSPGVYTQVRMYQSWINEQLVRTSIPPAGPTPHPGFQ